MSKWKTVRVPQELIEAVERTLESENGVKLSQFVSEAIQIRLGKLKEDNEKTKPVTYPMIHERLLYSPKHLWAMVTPEGNVRLGLSDYAQTHIGGIVNIHTDQIGSEVSKEKPFGVIETWMFKFDLNSPIAGKLVRVNKAVQDEPSTLNKDPYGDGWIAEIRPVNLIKLEEDLRSLMKPHNYKIWTSKLQWPRGAST